VLKHLAQATNIAFDRGNFQCLVSDLIAALQMKREAISEWFGYVPLCEGDSLACQRRNIDQAIFDLISACLELSDLEQAIGQELQALACFLDHLEKLALFLRGKLPVSAQKRRSIPIDHRQGRAELMTNGGQKLDKKSFCLLERGLWRPYRFEGWESLQQ
jgi:hypothetical protein